MWGQTITQWEISSEGNGAAACRIPDEPNEQVLPVRTGDGTPESAKPQPSEIRAPGWPFRATTEASGAGPTDDELVARLLQGQTEAFGELIGRHYSTCLKRATFMIRNRSEAEDEVQNACCKAFQHLDQYRGEGTFSAWLGRIVENQCLMRMREERKSQFVYLDEASESNVRLELVGQMPNPEDELGEEQVVSLVRREICLIPPLLRTVMLLRDVQQLPMPEVAAQLGLSVPAAKSRLMRARAELRHRVAKHCGPKGCETLIQRSKYKQVAYCRAS